MIKRYSCAQEAEWRTKKALRKKAKNRRELDSGRWFAPTVVAAKLGVANVTVERAMRRLGIPPGRIYVSRLPELILHIRSRQGESILRAEEKAQEKALLDYLD